MKNIIFKIFIAIVMILFASNTWASIRGFDNNDLNLGSFSKLRCGTNVTCSEVSGQLNVSVVSIANATSIQGDGTGAFHGFRMNIISVTADDSPTASECGSIFLNTIAVASITLPDAGSVHGCAYTFTNAIVGSRYDIRPASQDRIALLTVSLAHLIRSVSQGHSVTLAAVSADAWVPIGISSIQHWLQFPESDI